MPGMKSKSTEPVEEGQKSLLQKNGATSDDEHDAEWVVSYKKNGDLSAVEEGRKSSSNASTVRSFRDSAVQDLQMEDSGFGKKMAILVILGVMLSNIVVDQRTEHPPTQINRRMFILIVVGAAIGVAAVVCVVVFYLRSTYIPANYIVVVDAGSSHTKMNVFHYRGDKLNGTGVIEQLFFSTCNGTLSGLKGNYSALKDNWMPCLLLCKEKIPAERWDKTEVYVGATAGVRQLQRATGSVTHLLDDVRKLLNETYQLPSNQTHVDIITGDEEGALAWTTVNFITGRLIPPNATNADVPRLPTYGSLDLGGGSTQITFATNGASPHSNLELAFFGTRYHLHTRSFKCRGKGEALKILKGQLVVEYINQGRTDTLNLPCYPAGSWTAETDASLFASDCSAHLRSKIKAPRASYAFYGTGNVTECTKRVRMLFGSSECPLQDPDCSFASGGKVNATGPFMGFAGLYFVMDFFNLTRDDAGISVKLSQFRDVYRRQCETPWSKIQNSSNPFIKGYCFDGVYIDLLLTDIYGFGEEAFERIEFRKAIDGVQTGWTVGLALNSTNAVVPEVEVEIMSRAFFLIFLVIFAVFLVLAISFLCRGVIKSCRENV